MQFNYTERDIYKPCSSRYIKALYDIKFNSKSSFYNAHNNWDIVNKFKNGYYPIILDFANSPPLDTVSFYCFMIKTFGDYLKEHTKEQYYSDFIIVGSQELHKKINYFIDLGVFDMEQVTKERLIEDFIKEITKLYQDDKSYKGRDYIFNVDWGIFKDNYRDWIYARKELTYTDFLLFWNGCGWIISSIKEDGDMRVSGLSKSEEFLFDLAYHQVKEYNKR